MLVSILSPESGIITTKNIYFKDSDRKKYKELFLKIKSDGFIRNDVKFEDNTWILIANDHEYSIDIQIDEIAFKRASKESDINISSEDFTLGLKAFALNIANYTAPSSIHQIFYFLFKLIKEIGFFPSDKVKEFKTLLSNKNRILAFGNIIELFDFLKIPIPDEYCDVWYEKNESLDWSSKTRRIPDFKSIFAFGDVVVNFMNNASEEDVAKYGIVVLWWHICNNVPMRPTEFVLMEKDCAYKHEGNYYLKIKRNIGKGPQHTRKIINEYKAFETYDIDTIRIDEKIFNIIGQYNTLMDKLYPDRGKYLFDKRIYTEIISPFDNGVMYLNKDKFTCRNLKATLDLFYEEIIYGRYNKQICTKTQKSEDLKIKKIKDRQYNDHIEMLSPYDIRHIAIINLILMGAEPLTVMRLARHKKIRTTMGYYDHVSEYGNSYILTYSKMIKERKTRRAEKTSKGNGVELYELVDNEHEYSSAIHTWELVTSKMQKKTQYREVDGGLCKYLKGDLAPCYAVGGNHSRCPYFIQGDDMDIKKEFFKETTNVNGLLKTIKDLVENHSTITNFSEKYSVAIEKYTQGLNNASNIASNFNDDKIVERLLEEDR